MVLQIKQSSADKLANHLQDLDWIKQNLIRLIFTENHNFSECATAAFSYDAQMDQLVEHWHTRFNFKSNRCFLITINNRGNSIFNHLASMEQVPAPTSNALLMKDVEKFAKQVKNKLTKAIQDYSELLLNTDSLNEKLSLLHDCRILPEDFAERDLGYLCAKYDLGKIDKPVLDEATFKAYFGKDKFKEAYLKTITDSYLQDTELINTLYKKPYLADELLNFMDQENLVDILTKLDDRHGSQYMIAFIDMLWISKMPDNNKHKHFLKAFSLYLKANQKISKHHLEYIVGALTKTNHQQFLEHLPFVFYDRFLDIQNDGYIEGITYYLKDLTPFWPDIKVLFDKSSNFLVSDVSNNNLLLSPTSAADIPKYKKLIAQCATLEGADQNKLGYLYDLVKDLRKLPVIECKNVIEIV